MESEWYSSTCVNLKNNGTMTYKSTFILSFIFLLISTSLFAQEQGKDVTITASGSGSTQSEAQQMALRSAIEQAFGAFISSKTEIFNDQLVADQMSSVSSGNIKSFEVLNESQLPNGTWASTIKAIVSVDKLTSFVQAKGVAVEVKGGLFAVNIKQQILNEEGEVKAVADMVGLLHETMQTAFDYEIQTKDPVSLDSENKKWSISYEVTATTNSNMEFCSDYFIKTLRAISLSPSEVENYKTLNKNVFDVNIKCISSGEKMPEYRSQATGALNGFTPTHVFYLRNSSSIDAINSLLSNVEFYIRLFTVQNGIENKNGDKVKQSKYEQYKNYHTMGAIHCEPGEPLTMLPGNIILPSAGVAVRNFKSTDNLTLTEIEKITKYSVAPRGVVSQFKHGGYLVYEENGKGLVCSIIDIDKKDSTLSLNGYNDWEIPNNDDFNWLISNLEQKGIGNININTAYLISDNQGTKRKQIDKTYMPKKKCCRFVRRFGESTMAVSATASASTTGNEANNSAPENLPKTAPAGADSIIYVNSLQCRLVIRNKKENSFEYTLYNKGQTGACSGLDDFLGEASSTQTEPAPEKRFEEPGVMIFIFIEDGKALILEPDPSYVGFDCAGEFDNSFELQIKP